MKALDKIIDYFFDKRIKVKYISEVREAYGGSYIASIYAKLPFVKKYCIWSSYSKDINDANEKIQKAYSNQSIVSEYVSLVTYIDKIWYDLKQGWLNVVDIIDDNSNIIKKSKGVFKKPVKKWYWGFGIHKRPFKPFDDDWVNHILYINKWSMVWKSKYDYVCFEDNAQIWICLFKFFWFGYKLVSPFAIISPDGEEFEDPYWEQMIWYVNYSDCDLKKAKETYEIHCGKWNDDYLI